MIQCGSKMSLPEPIKGQGNKNYGKVNFSCPRSRNPTSGTKSRITACPFRAYIIYFYPFKYVSTVDKKTPWGLVIRESEHNYEMSIAVKKSVTLRRQARQTLEDTGTFNFQREVERLSGDGQNFAGKIVTELREHLNIYVTVEDVKSAQKRLRVKKYGPYSATQLFLAELDSRGIIYFTDEDPDTKRINRVF